MWVAGAAVAFLGVLAVLAVLAAYSAGAVRGIRRRSVRAVPLRLPVTAADQEALRALLAGEGSVEALDLLRRRYRLEGDDAHAVADDVAAHGDYPQDWHALAAALDADLRARVRGLVAQDRRSAALRLVAARFDLPAADADRLLSALCEEPPGDGE